MGVAKVIKMSTYHNIFDQNTSILRQYYKDVFHKILYQRHFLINNHQ